MSDVIIREARAEDAKKVIAYMQLVSAEPNNNILYEEGEFNFTVEEEQRILRDVAASENSVFVVADADGEVVGIANIAGGRRRAARCSGTIGITLHPDYRDQGIGTRLMQYLIDWARATGIITRLELHVFTRNERAIHLYEKMGFVSEGVQRKAFIKDGEYVDSMVMGLLLEG